MHDTFFFIVVRDARYCKVFGPYPDLNSTVELVETDVEGWFVDHYQQDMGTAWEPTLLVISITEELKTSTGFEFIVERYEEIRYNGQDVYG